MAATRQALEFMEGLSWEHPNEPMGHGFIPDALAEVEAYEKLAEEAAESVDIGDEINRCRICWETWGDHREDCPVPEIAKEDATR